MDFLGLQVDFVKSNQYILVNPKILNKFLTKGLLDW